MHRQTHTSTLLALLGLLAACTTRRLAPVDVDLTTTNAEAAALIRELRSAIEADSRNADKRGALGLALEANGMPKAELQTYLEAEGLAPNDRRWSYLAALTSALASEPDTALAVLDRFPTVDDAYVPAYLYRGA